MRLITLGEARDQCKADGDDDDLIELYGNAAESYCAALANRSLFATTAEHEAAVATVGTRMAEAYQAYDSAVEIANNQDDDRVTGMMIGAAEHILQRTTTECENDLHGLALDAAESAVGLPGRDAIRAAILMTVAHYYATRPAVLTGQGAAAVEVPNGVRDIMHHYRWTGPL